MTLETPTDIARLILSLGWLQQVDQVAFLAAGEYNENHIVTAGGASYVFRINHGSQLGLEDQISYEYSALRAVRDSRRTPTPYACEPPGATHPGVLLMSYVPGRTFSYERDDLKAAETLARIHGLDPTGSSDARRLLRQSDAVKAIVAESRELIKRHQEHPKAELGPLLLRHADRVEMPAEEVDTPTAEEPDCIVNTEINSGNFIVDDSVAHLVDWEKAVVSNRYQDLAHFLIPTTTLWKTDFRYDRSSRRRFLEAYRGALDFDIPLDELSERTDRMERVILLRALSWCYMAYHEYTQTSRRLTNEHTFSRIRRYLDEIQWFLR